MLSGKKILSAVLSAALLLPAASALAEDDAFAAEIERRYTVPSIDNRSEVRWWMAEAGNSTCSDFPPAPSTTSNSTTFVSGTFSRYLSKS